MECLRCGNKDERYFYHGHKGIYCRKCVVFKRILLSEEPEVRDYLIGEDIDDYSFEFELTPYQKKAADDCLEYLKGNNDVLLHCITGAGKTEIAVKSIADYLKRGLKVCYAISRREVVVELGKRFEKIFKKAKVVSVYGNHHDILSGDLIVCTCHQLYRYYQTFDLLIIDEVDAFPLKGNELLMNVSMKACRGQLLFSTATLNEEIRNIVKKRKMQTVRLLLRPSLKELTMPKVCYLPNVFSYFFLYYLFKNSKRQFMVFVSSKKEASYLMKVFSIFFDCTHVYADLKEREKNIREFKDRKKQIIFTTTVLERGVTINNINVIILFSYPKIFDASSLIQMSGRVNRGLNDNEGRVYIFSPFKNRAIDECLNSIKEANDELSLL